MMKTKRVPLLSSCFPALIALFLTAAAPARVPSAQTITVKAAASKTLVALNEQLDYQIIIESSQTSLNSRELGIAVPPSFSGLTPLSNQYNMSAATRSIRLSLPVRASRVGMISVSGCKIKYGTTTYSVPTITIKVVKTNRETWPTLLKSGDAFTATCKDANLNDTIAGKMFARATFTKAKPYQKESFVAECELYVDDSLQQNISSPAWAAPKTWTDFYSIQQEMKSYPSRSVSLEGRPFTAFTIARYILTPLKVGKTAIPRHNATCTIPVRKTVNTSSGGNTPGGVSFFQFNSTRDVPEEITLPLAPALIEIQPLPPEGRPPSFQGAVGQYTFAAQIDRKNMTQDDLLTLTCQIGGLGFIGAIDNPRLPETLDWKQYGEPQIKIEPAQGNASLGGKKTFEYLFRPQKPGSLTIPQIAFSYFDPKQKRYIEILKPQLEPFKIEVAPGVKKELLVATASPGTISPGNASPGGANPTEVIAERIAFIHAAQPVLAYLPAPFFGRVNFILLLTLPLFLPALALAARVRGAYVERNHERLRFRSAGGRARKELKTARATLNKNDLEGFYAHLPEALRGYLATKLQRSSSGLTLEQIEDACLDHDIDPESIDALRCILEECDRARYISIDEDAAAQAREMLQEADELLSKLDKAFG